jgi:hypothetical protein
MDEFIGFNFPIKSHLCATMSVEAVQIQRKSR